MNNLSKSALILGIATSVLSSNSLAQSHCQQNEYVFFNGKCGKTENDKFTGSKVLSLCADKEKGMTKLEYRFGVLAKVEMKYSAPADGSFLFTNQQIMPRASVDVIYFSKGKFTYALTNCMGMHCGKRDFNLMVFNDKKLVANLVCEPEIWHPNDFEVRNSTISVKNSDLNFDVK